MHKFMKMTNCKTQEEFYQKYPSEEHFFAAYPHMKGNQTMKNGGAASGHAGSYWNGDSWVSTAGDSGTYSNGTYFANGGPIFPIGGSAPVFGMGGNASFNVSNNEYPTPFAMYPGTGNGSGYLQDLSTQMAFGGITPGAQLVTPFAMNPGTGMGGGMLQDLPNEMKKGGHHHKGGHKKKHLTPQQLQVMMQAMSQAQGQPQGQGMPQGMPQGAMMGPQDPSQQMMSPQDQQMMAMQQAQQGQQQQQMSPQDQQAMMQQQQMQQQQQGGQPMPGMKQGGIHIKKSHEGIFTAYKQRTGKTTEETLHSPDPHVRQMANFARNAAKWHHEYGGNTMMQDGGATMPNNPGFRALPFEVQQKIMNNMQTGGMITPGRTMYEPGGEYGNGGQYGMGNPYHPLARFMAMGGNFQDGGTNGRSNVTSDTPPGAGNDAGFQGDPNGSAFSSDNSDNQDGYNPSTDPNNPVNNPDNNPPNVADDSQNSPSNEMKCKDAQGNPMKCPDSNKAQKPNWGKAILGTGMAAFGIAGTYAALNEQKKLQNKQFNDRLSSNAIAAVNQPGGHGDYDYNGTFRPDQRTPTKAGIYYPGQGAAMYGGRMQMGGMPIRDTFAQGGYHAGQELELSDAEIANLKRMGYKIDML